jgi:dsDNA-binding SOS-regulon protein
MPTDPTVDDAKTAILRTRIIMQEFGNHTDISVFMKEAEEVYSKILKANYENYSQEIHKSD